MCTAFPCPDYYESSVPSRRHPPTTSVPFDQLAAGRRGDRRDGSHVHHEPLDRRGAQLCPCDFATPTPQAFGVASRPATSTDQRVPPTISIGVRVAAQPRSVRFELVVHS
jgi:hypothetical protein